MVATLFDFNGVLVDDEHVHLEAFRDILAPRGILVTDQEYKERYLGFDDAGAFRAILADRGHPASDDAIRALVLAKKPAYMTRIAGALRVFPGAAELVARRAARGMVGIVSGALAHEIEYALEAMRVRDRVAFIVSAESVAASKPHPEGFLAAVEELARRGSEHRVVVIEDSIAGVVAARAAGLRCVAVAHTYAVDELLGAGANAVVADLLALDDATLDGADA